MPDTKKDLDDYPTHLFNMKTIIGHWTINCCHDSLKIALINFVHHYIIYNLLLLCKKITVAMETDEILGSETGFTKIHLFLLPPLTWINCQQTEQRLQFVWPFWPNYKELLIFAKQTFIIDRSHEKSDLREFSSKLVRVRKYRKTSFWRLKD